MTECAEPPASTAIVVLNWNGQDLLLRALTSLKKCGQNAHVCIVDNGSTDESVRLTEEQFPGYSVIRAPVNLGFSGGNNLGIRWALKQGFEIIGILNNDVVVAPGFLTPLVEALRVDYGKRFASPQIRYLDDVKSVWFGSAAVEHRTGIYVHRSSCPEARGITPTPVVTGCALFAHRSVWEQVGLLDESYFLTFEDTEWCVRAQAHGCAGLVVNESVVYHAVSATISAQPHAVPTYYYVRNGVRFLRHAPIEHSGHAVVFIFDEVRRTFAKAAREPSAHHLREFGAVLRGAFDGFRDRGGRL